MIKAFILYYTISAPTTPKWVVINIIPCLGYFILPIDLVPDFLVGVGFIDDIAAFGITLKMMSGPIRDMLRDFATPDILIKRLIAKHPWIIFSCVREMEVSLCDQRTFNHDNIRPSDQDTRRLSSLLFTRRAA